MKRAILPLLMLCAATTQAQLHNSDVCKLPEITRLGVRTPLRIPDIPGYRTLKCDLHIHTIFSDGQVWPETRVDEAWRGGLDAIAITDHIEVRVHKEILKGDLNESYRVAKAAGDKKGIIVIPGIEITRAKPFGHMNALFINDANPIDTPNQMDALNEALRQKAFILWNHPGWPDDKSTLYDLHKKLLEEKKIHGIEIVNGAEYYPRTIDWCREYGVAHIGNSDIHPPIEAWYGTDAYNRPMNLVFVEEWSEKGIRDALFAGRSVTMVDGMLFGPQQYLAALVEASLDFRFISTDTKGNRTYEVTNNAGIPFRITAGEKFHLIPALQAIRITLPTEGVAATVDNCLYGEKLPLPVTLPLGGK